MSEIICDDKIFDKSIDFIKVWWKYLFYKSLMSEIICDDKIFDKSIDFIKVWWKYWFYKSFN
jgi:hypothetical protein